ncbi:MAG TPA: septum formation family protein [Marmoricola sp.]
MVRRIVVLLALGLLTAGCSHPLREDADDRLTPPKLGACRDLEAADLERPSNSTPTVACSKDHTAQTFLVGTLPATTGKGYRDEGHGRHVFATCTDAFREFLGADESLAMRAWLSWAWFRPSERGWERGARWFRCDLVGGPSGATELHRLPDDAKGLFTSDLPDEWLLCARGETIPGSTKVRCSEDHEWRAVATIKVGQPDDPYPGDRIVQVRSRDRCSDWVGAWSHYPVDYAFGYTWFHEAEWSTGNRRSVCWARTAQ